MTQSTLRPARLRPARRSLPRLHPLAACLASALFMHGGLLGAATPTTAPAAPLVQNCDDDGAGSLRSAVAAASEGDVIDLGGLACPEITLTSGALVIAPTATNLTIVGPGADALTISGGDSSRIFEQQATGLLGISGLTLTHGLSVDSGGCILAHGSLALTGVTVSACAAGSANATDISGGGAYVMGNAVLVDSHFTGNGVDGNLRVRGGAVAVAGTLSVDTSTFTGNHARSHDVGGGTGMSNIVEGGAIEVLGDTVLTASTVSGNSATSDTYEVFGGGIAVGSHPDNAIGSLDVSNSEISGNTVDSGCPVCAPQGGGIAAVGVTRLHQTVLSDNSVGSSGHYGGAGGMRVFYSPTAEIVGGTISGNHADSAGGGLIGPEQGVLSITGTRIHDNFAGNQGGTDEGGGGVLCFGCSIQLSSSSISGNVAEAGGGGVGVLFGEYAPAPMSITNSTISGNTANEGGGVMIDGGNAQVSNSTIAFNEAGSRGAGISASEYSYQIQLQSTIVSNNLTGTAAGNVWAFPETVSGANNLIPDAESGPAQMPPDTITQDPLLLPLADNGGATLTHALGDGSPAIDSGNDAAGLGFDQRGAYFVREYGAAADIGAYEQQPTPDTVFRNGFED